MFPWAVFAVLAVVLLTVHLGQGTVIALCLGYVVFVAATVRRRHSTR